jgi:hypothetical protein
MTSDLTAAFFVAGALALTVIGAWLILFWIENNNNMKGG